MTTNSADLLEEIARLMELKGENPFKVRAYQKAVEAIAEEGDLTERARAGTLTEIKGIGKGISDVLTEFLIHGKTTARDELLAALPMGIMELTQIPGLGPKRALRLIEELDVHSVRELEYACRENHLIKLKGFGVKAQEQILQGIQFLTSNDGLQRISDALETVKEAASAIQKAVGTVGQLHETGALRRRLEILQQLEFLVVTSTESQHEALQEKVQKAIEQFKSRNSKTLPIQVYYTSSKYFGYDQALLTGSLLHWKALKSPERFEAKSEEEFYKKLGFAWIPPECREIGEEVALSHKGEISILPEKGVRGIFHNHTTWSDGIASVEEMVAAAEKAGYDYIGISDHSQSAFYAQGLKPNDLAEQRKEIKKAQDKHPGIRVFWGIESDILADGSLDYDDQALKEFDFVIGSIHSRFKMDREAMTDRILTAIRHPRTRFLGHATGRLLLGRPGYDLDMERIIQEAARYDVAIEINANPARLDIDWRWGPQLRKYGTKVSVNPDAHEVAGIGDVHFGVTVARKALLPQTQVINAGSVQEVEAWLRRS